MTMDEDVAARLLALAPAMPDADSLASEVRIRHVSQRRARITLAGATALMVGTIGVAALAWQHEESPASQAGPGPLRPPCSFGTVFRGFQPGTSSATVTRTRGSAPTQLVAHAGRGDYTLSNVQIVVGHAPVVRTGKLGSMPADGRDLPIVVGDMADDGTPIAPGRYDVVVSGDVSGLNNCGEDAWQHVETVAGILVVR